MGTWGPGVFQSDDAGEFFDVIRDKLIYTIVYFLAGENMTGEPVSDGRGRVEMAVDLLALFCERYNFDPTVDRKVIRHWRELTLAYFESDSRWDDCQTADGLDARTERRKVIEATFDRFEAV